MAGIINWNELWKTMRTGHYWGKAHDKDADSMLECAKKFREWAMRDRKQAEKQKQKIPLNLCDLLIAIILTISILIGARKRH